MNFDIYFEVYWIFILIMAVWVFSVINFILLLLVIREHKPKKIAKPKPEMPKQEETQESLEEEEGEGF